MMRKRRCLILRDCFLEYKLGTEKRLKWLPFIKIKTSWKEAVARGSLMGYDLITLWSRKQIKPHAELYQLPENRFIFVPYKADHAQDSKTDVCDIPINNFIFSGGNSKRDYKTLVEAVKGTNIPVIISATSPAVRATIEYQPNVIVLGAPEPAFAQLQAACRFVVMATANSGLRASAETNCCNGMWHRKALVAADTMAADDYIIEGETGYIVPSGDVEGLRKRILELWNDPEKCEEMGRKGREHCEKWFKHSISMRRIIHTAIVCWENKRKGTSLKIVGDSQIHRERVQVFFAANAAYYQHTCVLVVSILEHNSDLGFDFYIMTDKESPKEAAKILSVQKRYPNCSINFIVMDNSKFEHLPLRASYISLQMYYRYLIPILLPDKDKALYLDSDMVCNGSLRPLWEMEIDDYYVAGRLDGWVCRDDSEVADKERHRSGKSFLKKLGLSPEHFASYVNSGTLLMNLRKIRDDGMIAQLFENTDKLSTVFQHPDQDVINYTFQGKVKVIDRKWNSMGSGEDNPDIRKDFVIIHYNGGEKPWWRGGLTERKWGRELYFQYLLKTPWRRKWWVYKVWYPPFRTAYRLFLKMKKRFRKG